VEAEMKNANGAGDASMAALVNAYLRGLNLTESAQFASRVEAKTVESAKTINESIAELIEKEETS
jgi:sugar/nucleoside kinase (ribokinase family)